MTDKLKLGPSKFEKIFFFVVYPIGASAYIYAYQHFTGKTWNFTDHWFAILLIFFSPALGISAFPFQLDKGRKTFNQLDTGRKNFNVLLARVLLGMGIVGLVGLSAVVLVGFRSQHRTSGESWDYLETAALSMLFTIGLSWRAAVTKMEKL